MKTFHLSLTAHTFITTDAQFEAMTQKQHNKTGNKIPKSAHQDKTNLRKVSGFALCTKPYEGYLGGPNIAGTGAFSYPVYPGDCEEVRSLPTEWFMVETDSLNCLKYPPVPL